MTGLPSLPVDRLSLTVFGPGFGESSVIGVPPGEWLVVDSLIDPSTRTNPALELLREHDARPTMVVLTHPHDDHAAGFDRILESQGRGLVGCVPTRFGTSTDALADPDVERALAHGRAEHALAAIFDRWERHAEDVFRLSIGEVRTIGEATVTVHAPRDKMVERARAGRRVDPNRVSAALVVEWRQTRVVLGADLPAIEWRTIDRDRRDNRAGDHAGLKVPHHGSLRAQADVLAVPQDGRVRTWVVTPWNRGSKLPRFEKEEGMDVMLQRVEEVRLTSLPSAVALRAGGDRHRRGDIDDATRRRRFGGDDIVLEYDSSPSSTEAAWTSIVFAPDGGVESIDRGSAAVTVVS